MSTVTTATTARPTTRMRVGLVLCILLGLANLPFLLEPTAAGEVGPPYPVIVLGAVLGVVSIVGCVMAWRTGDRTALRVAAACLIVNTVTSLPAFFVDVDPGIKIGTALTVLVSVLALVLMFSRGKQVVAD